MPGIDIGFSSGIVVLRFSPDENLMYAEKQTLDGRGAIEVYDLHARIKLYELQPNGSGSKLSVIAPFSTLPAFILGTFSDPNPSFGFLPMPAKRLQVLFYQTLDGGFINQPGDVSKQFGFPKWIVLDFDAKRTYAYAPGRFDQNNGAYKFLVNDALLNYDEEGNLYATSNGKAFLIKTQQQ